MWSFRSKILNVCLDAGSVGFMEEKKKILIYYGVFFASFFLTLVPVSVVSVFSLMICACAVAAIYMERARQEDDSLISNHMTFLIRSFWRGNLYLVLSSLCGLMYLLLMADYETFGACVDAMLRAINSGSFERLGGLAHACEKLFLKENADHLKTSAFIAFIPIVTYLLYRCAYGWMHGTHGKLISDDKL